MIFDGTFIAAIATYSSGSSRIVTRTSAFPGVVSVVGGLTTRVPAVTALQIHIIISSDSYNTYISSILESDARRQMCMKRLFYHSKRHAEQPDRLEFQ